VNSSLNLTTRRCASRAIVRTATRFTLVNGSRFVKRQSDPINLAKFGRNSCCRFAALGLFTRERLRIRARVTAIAAGTYLWLCSTRIFDSDVRISRRFRSASGASLSSIFAFELRTATAIDRKREAEDERK
jgi:hypothetical protein